MISPPNEFPMPAYDECPVCGKHYEVRCKCPLGDMVCPDGHEWHHCMLHGNTVLGKADHSLPANRCRCKIGDTESGKYLYEPEKKT